MMGPIPAVSVRGLADFLTSSAMALVLAFRHVSQGSDLGDKVVGDDLADLLHLAARADRAQQRRRPLGG